MNKIFLILALALLAMSGQSQSILDLTQQLAFDTEKLASLKSTLQEMVQGYTQLKTDYTRIRDIVKDNFNLHKAFLDALWVLSPAVRGDPRMGAIVNTASKIITAYRSGALTAANPVFTAQELAYINGTLAALLDRCNEELDELSMVTTDFELRMSDDQRIAVLDHIEANLQTELAFCREFNKTLAVEAARRQKEAGDLHTLKRLYGLPD
jgi:hypothetical protein